MFGILRIWIDRLNVIANRASPGSLPRNIPPDFVRFDRASELLTGGQKRFEYRRFGDGCVLLRGIAGSC